MRKQNAEMYNLIGRPPAAGRDPWTNPTPNPKAHISIARTDSPAKVTKVQGPPKPPKTASLRKVSAGIARPTREALHDRQADVKDDTRHTPKALPKIPFQHRKHDQSTLAAQDSVKVRPKTLPKPGSSVEAAQNKRVTLTVTNYDIPQYRDGLLSQLSTSEDTRPVQGKLVSVPVFKFGEESADTNRDA